MINNKNFGVYNKVISLGLWESLRIGRKDEKKRKKKEKRTAFQIVITKFISSNPHSGHVKNITSLCIQTKSMEQFPIF
jgi:hypothetical protein